MDSPSESSTDRILQQRLDTTPEISKKSVITAIAEDYGYNVDYHRYYDKASFQGCVENSSRPFDILYFAAHGNKSLVIYNNEIGENKEAFTWVELGRLFCMAGGLTENTKVLLASCDGGFKRGR